MKSSSREIEISEGIKAAAVETLTSRDNEMR